MNVPRHTMAEGCCSAVEPCSHQRQDPTTICENCQEAAKWAKERDAKAGWMGDIGGNPYGPFDR